MGSISFGGNFPHSAGMMALLWMDLTPRNVGRLYYRETSENPETFAVSFLKMSVLIIYTSRFVREASVGQFMCPKA